MVPARGQRDKEKQTEKIRDGRSREFLRVRLEESENDHVIWVFYFYYLHRTGRWSWVGICVWCSL